MADIFISYASEDREKARVLAASLEAAGWSVWWDRTILPGRCFGIGLLYIVLWEGLFSGFVAGVRTFSIRHYSMALMHALDARRFAADRHMSGTIVAMTSVVLFTVFVLLSIRRLRRMDVP